MLGEGSVHDPMASTYLEKFIGNKDMQNFYLKLTQSFMTLVHMKVSLQMLSNIINTISQIVQFQKL